MLVKLPNPALKTVTVLYSECNKCPVNLRGRSIISMIRRPTRVSRSGFQVLCLNTSVGKYVPVGSSLIVIAALLFAISVIVSNQFHGFRHTFHLSRSRPWNAP